MFHPEWQARYVTKMLVVMTEEQPGLSRSSGPYTTLQQRVDEAHAKSTSPDPGMSSGTDGDRAGYRGLAFAGHQ